MKYVCTKFSIDSAEESMKQIARELLADACGEIGYESFVDTDDGLEGYVQQDLFSQNALDALLEANSIDGVTVTADSAPVADKDWNETWENEEGFAPVCIDKHLVIYDALHTDPSKLDNSYSIEIGIHARNAFGTGTHETTRMMVSSIMSLPVAGKRILDCGCGTGILGIAALKCGANEVIAYDIDEWSVKNTQYNAQLNGLSDKITVYEGNVSVLSHVSGVFDFIFANINRNILLSDMPVFKEVMASGAYLVISGFYKQDITMLTAKATDLGLKLLQDKSDGDWHCLTFVA